MIDPTRRASIGDVFRTLRTLMGIALKAAPTGLVLSLVTEPLGFLATVLMAYGFKVITNGVVGGDARLAMQGASMYIGLWFVMTLFQGWGVRLRITMDERTRLAVQERLARLVGGLPGLDVFERPALLDRLELVREQQDTLTQGFGWIVVGAGALLRVVGTVALLATISPVLILLLLVGLVPNMAEAYAQKHLQTADEESAEPKRLMRHLLESATSPGPAKEVRVFGLGAHLLDRMGQAADRAGRAQDRARVRYAATSIAGWVVYGLAFAGSIVFVAWQAMRGGAMAGDVVMAVYLAQQVSGNVGQLSSSIQNFGQLMRIMRYFTWLEQFARAQVTSAGGVSAPVGTPTPPSASRAVPRRLSRGIVIDNLSFAYPGTDRAVLRDLNLELPAGAVVAMVGDNGAGKTTLAKLLTRMYTPSAGRILVDGTDLAYLPLDDWRRACAAAFQDFVRFELLAREAVGVGDLAHLDDEEAVLAALDRAGASDIPAQLEGGLAAQLGKTWGGTDLSGGQWQKLALARGMMRVHPLLTVLDEPTASLDAETEDQLFRRYADISRARSDEGAITLLVSHRFTTVRMADLILVLDGGRLAESGSHESLIAAGGLYAELFELQASGYR